MVKVSLLCFCLLCPDVSFILLPFCLIVSVCYKVMCPGDCIVWASAIVSFLSISIKLECSCLCSLGKQSTSVLKLSSACGQVGFVISFQRWSSVDMGVAFMCLCPCYYASDLGHPYLVASSSGVFCSLPHYCSMHL